MTHSCACLNRAYLKRKRYATYSVRHGRRPTVELRSTHEASERFLFLSVLYAHAGDVPPCTNEDMRLCYCAGCYTS